MSYTYDIVCGQALCTLSHYFLEGIHYLKVTCYVKICLKMNFLLILRAEIMVLHNDHLMHPMHEIQLIVLWKVSKMISVFPETNLFTFKVTFS